MTHSTPRLRQLLLITLNVLSAVIVVLSVAVSTFTTIGWFILILALVQALLGLLMTKIVVMRLGWLYDSVCDMAEQAAHIKVEKPIRKTQLDDITVIRTFVASIIKEYQESLDEHERQLRSTTELLNEIIQRERRQQNELLILFETLSTSMKRFAMGYLNVDVNAEHAGIANQLFHDYNASLEAIRAMIFRIFEALSGSMAMSQDISMNAEEVVRRVREQSEQTTLIAQVAGQVGEVVARNTENTTEAAATANAAMKHVQEGAEKIHSTTQGISLIVEATRRTADKITSLTATIDEISTITATINEIADQTNLLALNAAIEAARAGEQGRGFAVVADEVRKLAERTSQATKEITRQIHTIHADANDAVQAMRSSEEAVEKGIALSNEAAQAFERVRTEIERVAQSISSVAIATEEQAATVSAVIEQINDLAQQAQQSNQIVSNISLAAESLLLMNENLKENVDFFKFDEE
jgi:methyl-accepting chemotaxis protein